MERELRIVTAENGVTLLRIPQFETIGGVRAAFATRLGGVSEGCHASLNLGFTRGDAPERVEENYTRYCKAFGIEHRQLVFSRQVHSNVVHRVEAPGEGELAARYTPRPGDGMTTDKTGVYLTTFYADCVPILLYDPVKKAVAAVHSGWRGSALGIAGGAVEAMAARYGTNPKDLLAAVGPAINGECYEVGEEVALAFRKRFGTAAPVRMVDGHLYADIKGAVALALREKGVREENLTVSSLCTHCRTDLFFSHRKMGDARGVLFGAIGLE